MVKKTVKKIIEKPRAAIAYIWTKLNGAAAMLVMRPPKN